MRRVTQAWATGQPQDFRRRGTWLVLAFAAMAIAVLARLAQVQVLQSPQLAAQAAAQHTTSVTLHGDRGLIVDRDGRVLASNRVVYDVFVDPALVESSQRAAVAKQIAPILKISVAAIEKALSQPNQFDYLVKGASEDVHNRLAALNLPGVGAIPSQQRVDEPSPVPGISFAANLLGYVDADGQGQYGLEQYYDDVLSGTQGHESALVDLEGNPIVLSGDRDVPAENGKNLQLGLDSQAQYVAELALAQGVTKAQAQSGTLMIMDTKTGALRAWAQYPSFDANDYGSADIADFRDLALSQPYEPGSVMKSVTFAGGLKNNAITPRTVIDERQQVIDGFLIHDWDFRSHGNVSMQTVLDLSLNNGAIAVQQREGKDAFYSNLLSFGMGSPTGVDLAGEINEPLRPQSQWNDLSYAEASFGQGVAVTPVEMLAAINAIANGGVWVQPHAVDAVVDPATGKSTPFVPTTRRVMPAAAASTLTHMMVGVVEDEGAEGFMAKIPGYRGDVAGKTGTASVAVNGVYGSDVIVSFAGFMPASHPQYTMMVVLRYPQEHGIPRFGSMLAAPIWKQVAQMLIDEWRIMP